jgi:hypothetical protein
MGRGVSPLLPGAVVRIDAVKLADNLKIKSHLFLFSNMLFISRAIVPNVTVAMLII